MSRTRRMARWGQLTVLLLSVACNGGDPGLGARSEPGPPGDDTTNQTEQPQLASDAGNIARPDATSPASCEVPRFEESPRAVPFAGLSATVIDDEGSPVGGVLAQACGLNVCLQQPTDAEGQVMIASDDAIAKVAFKYGDGLRYAQFALLLDGEGPHDLGQQRTVAFPPLEESDTIAAGESASSSGATLALAEATEVKLDSLSFPDEAQHVFVARELEQERLPQAVESQQFDAVWAFGPLKTQFCPAAELTLPNSAGFEPGARIDLYLHVTDIAGHWARYGEWGKVSQATVSDDGLHIVTDASHGLPELGVVGLLASGSTGSEQ